MLTPLDRPNLTFTRCRSLLLFPAVCLVILPALAHSSHVMAQLLYNTLGPAGRYLSPGMPPPPGAMFNPLPPPLAAPAPLPVPCAPPPCAAGFPMPPVAAAMTPPAYAPF